MNRAEMELLELGLLHPVVIPEVTRQADGRLQVGCRYRCPLPATSDVAAAIQWMVKHTEARP